MRVIGWKCWCVDVSTTPRGIVRFNSVDHAWDDVPNTVIVRMLYFDEMSVDGTIRYRRGEMGCEFYYTDPINKLYGSSNADKAEIQKLYPEADIRGSLLTDEQTYQDIQQEAMADHDVTGME